LHQRFPISQKLLLLKIDPHCLGRDAFQNPWGNQLNYVFPPFYLIRKGFQRVLQEPKTLILITPVVHITMVYKSSSNKYKQSSTQKQDLLTDPQNKFHPLVLKNTLKLVAWLVSGKNCKQREYLRRAVNRISGSRREGYSI